MIDTDDLGGFDLIGRPLHLYRRVKVFANGTTIWQCRSCGGRRCCPPIEGARHIQLKPEDRSAAHVMIHRDGWPSWPALIAEAPLGARLQ